MVVLILLKLFLFFGILFIFGWQLTRFVFNEKRIEALIPLAAIIGSGVYLFLLNSLSYLIDIKINFYLLLAIFILLSYFLFHFNKKKDKAEWGINKKWRIILLTTCFAIMVSAGIAGIRFVAYDEMGFNHFPLDATIAEGNFPVKNILSPNFPAQEHYGFGLFSAAVSKITDMPVWFSYDFLHIIFIGLIFLLGFLLIRDFCKDNFKAYFASLIMIFGSNLNFLYGIGGLSSLYQKYILNLPIKAPFKFLDDMIFSHEALGVGSSVMAKSDIAWFTLGFVLTITVVYLYFRAINDEKKWFRTSLLNGIIFSLLALSADVFFIVLCIVFLIYPLIFAILKRDWGRGKFYLKVSFLILFLGLIIASFQGGIITQAVKQKFLGYSVPIDNPLSISPEYLLKGLIFEEPDISFPIFSLTFFLRWGWLLIFIVPAGIYSLKKHFQLSLFLILLIFISFFLPLIVTAGVWQIAWTRTNFLTSLFWNLLFGLFLGQLLLSPPLVRKKGGGWQRSLIIILILCIVSSGLLFFVLSPFFPYLEATQSFLAGFLKKPNPAELEAFDWIKENSTIKDYFFTFDGEGEKSLGGWQNSKFVIYTGRFAPVFYYGMDIEWPDRYGALTFSPEMILYKKVLKECPPDALEILNYRYLYINEYWPEGLEEKCLANNNLKLEFEFEKGDNFARIYEIQNRY